MKFTTEKRKILPVLNKAAAVTEHKNTLPILAALRMETVGDAVIVSAYDLEVAYTGAVEGSTGKDGCVAVNAKALVAVVASLPEGPVELATEKTKLVVRAGDVEFRLATMASEEFPVLPEPKDGVTFPVSAEALHAVFGQVAYAVSFDETRYSLNGTFLEASAGRLKGTSTDGHRLAQHVVVCEKAEDTGGGVIVPRKVVGVLLKAVASEGPWTLTVSENTLTVESKDERIQARLIDGSFPDYTAVVPRAEGPGASFDRRALLAMLGRMKLVSEAVKFEAKDGKMTLSAQDSDRGEATEWFPVTDDVRCRFKLNGAYLRETLGSWSSEHVVVHLPEDELTPVLVVNGDAAESFCVIMPMRL